MSQRFIESRFVIVITSVLLLALVIVVFVCRPQNDLTYQGRTIEDWFEDLPLTLVMSDTNSRQVVATTARLTIGGQTYGNDTNTTFKALTAFEDFGTDAIPFLLTKLDNEDSAIEQYLVKLVTK